ncbi:MAG: CxxxxCH/CxxCH domain-containing protein [Pseudomonadota bacterium]
MKKKRIATTCLLAGFAFMSAPAVVMGACMDCHETTGCQTPAKPQGTCASCHLGDGDVNDFQMNFTAAIIDSGEWLSSGHGQTSIADDCEYCHDYDAGHGDTANPFRLANTGNPGAEGQNSACLACHGSDAVGFDPDGAETNFVTINSIVKIDANHAGGRHNALTDGGYFCWDCHDPHGDNNIDMIHDAVTKESDGQYGVPVATAPVVFTANSTGTDYARSATPFDGICQACHTSTRHYTSSSGDGHNATYSCVLCHEHKDGFKPNCIACHGYPPEVDTPQGQDGLVVIPALTGAASAGAHAVHTDPNGYGYSCYTCHYGGMPDSPITDDYRIQIGFDARGFSGSGSVYNGQTLNNPYTYQGTNGTTIGSGTPTTCANFYCHSNGTAVSTSFANPTTYPGPNQSSPAWDGTTTCTSCHGYGPSYAAGSPKANKHSRHLDLFTNPLINYDANPCHFCHFATTTDGRTITNKGNHANRAYNVVPDTNAIYRQNQLNSIPVNFTYAYDPAGGTCSNITCHRGIMSENASWGATTPISANAVVTPGLVCGDITLTITASSGTAPYTYYIDWESDGIWDYTGPDRIQPHTYSNTSTSKTITSYVRDATARRSNNLTSTVNFTTSPNILPTVAVTPSVAGYTVTLTDRSFDPDYAACGHNGPGSVRIDWRDGTIETPVLNLTSNTAGTGQQFTHTYSSGGNYAIRYYVYDNVITYPVTYTISPAVTVPQN